MAAAAMRPGPSVQPSHRRPPRRQHPRQQQLHQERDRQRQRQQQPHLPRAKGGSPRVLLVLLLLASSPLVQAELPGLLATQSSPPGLFAAQSSPQQQRHLIGQYQTGLTVESTNAPKKPQKQNLTIGYLTAIKGGLKDRQGLAISGALSMALDEVSEFSS